MIEGVIGYILGQDLCFTHKRCRKELWMLRHAMDARARASRCHGYRGFKGENRLPLPRLCVRVRRLFLS
jgi:hypothetical protein